MPRRFTDSTELFGDLLDRHEAGAANPIAYPDYAGFASVTAADAFIKELRLAQNAGAVRLVHGKGSRHEQIAHVRLEAADSLYRYLGRVPISGVVREAHATLVNGLALHPSLSTAAEEIAGAWTRARRWNGFSPDDAEKVHSVFVLAQAILDGRHAGMDYRTFSRRVSGDSKSLERLEGPTVRLLGRILDLPPDARPREALRTLGLEKFAPPLLISGQVDLASVDLSRASLLYLGIPPGDAARIRFRRTPTYLLTIENYTSFCRHILEADPDGMGVTIYVGGYPSLAAQQALRILVSKLPVDVPLFHWSDIDADGTWIFRTIERAVGRALRPHLMSSEIAERFGRPAIARPEVRECPRESGIAALVEYLRREGAKTLEQEELDPERPVNPRGRSPSSCDPVETASATEQLWASVTVSESG